MELETTNHKNYQHAMKRNSIAKRPLNDSLKTLSRRMRISSGKRLLLSLPTQITSFCKFFGHFINLVINKSCIRDLNFFYAYGKK